MGRRKVAQEPAGGSAPFGGKSGGAFKRAGGAEVDRNFGSAAVGKQAGDRFSARGRLSQAMNNGDGFNADVGSLEKKKDGQEVVGSGIGIDVYSPGSLRAKAGG